MVATGLLALRVATFAELATRALQNTIYMVTSTARKLCQLKKEIGHIVAENMANTFSIDYQPQNLHNKNQKCLKCTYTL
jgi:Tfp pilus assembly protein PilE